MNGYRILLIEDEIHLNEMLKMNLELDGYTVVSSGNGLQALHIAQEQAFDLIISDIMLPGMNGYKVCAELRQRGVEQLKPAREMRLFQAGNSNVHPHRVARIFPAAHQHRAPEGLHPHEVRAPIADPRGEDGADQRIFAHRGVERFDKGIDIGRIDPDRVGIAAHPLTRGQRVRQIEGHMEGAVLYNEVFGVAQPASVLAVAVLEPGASHNLRVEARAHALRALVEPSLLVALRYANAEYIQGSNHPFRSTD